MEIRPATVTDKAAVEQLVRAHGFDVDLDSLLDGGVSLVAVDDGSIVGAFLADADGTLRALASDADGAGRALGEAIARTFAERGVTTLRAELAGHDEERRTLVARWGFQPERMIFSVSIEDLLARLAGPSGACWGAIHVQTDDERPLQSVLARFIPRLSDAEVSPPQNGWIAVRAPQLDADPKLLRRLGHELSVVADAVVFILGVEHGAVVRYVLLERGAVVDEYLSVPDFYGPLPPGDVVALGANPTAVARLTGADAATIRALCRTATSPTELPPADELYRSIADAVGLSA